MAKKTNPFAKMTEKQDMAMDKKQKVKEGSKTDMKKDAKAGIKPYTKKK